MFFEILSKRPSHDLSPLNLKDFFAINHTNKFYFFPHFSPHLYTPFQLQEFANVPSNLYRVVPSEKQRIQLKNANRNFFNEGNEDKQTRASTSSATNLIEKQEKVLPIHCNTSSERFLFVKREKKNAFPFLKTGLLQRKSSLFDQVSSHKFM